MNESLADKDLYNKIRQHDSQRIHTLLYIEMLHEACLVQCFSTCRSFGGGGVLLYGGGGGAEQ
jgi:hypothetical protein